jgi:hypothetical protein
VPASDPSSKQRAEILAELEAAGAIVDATPKVVTPSRRSENQLF